LTVAGRGAVTTWWNNAPVDPSVLKHHVLLRVMFGHLGSPDRLKQILRDHIADVDRLQKHAAVDAEAAKSEPGWAYSQIVLQWAQRHYETERDLAEQLIDEIDAAATVLAKAKAERDVPIIQVEGLKGVHVVNKKTAKFTIDTLVEMLSRVGKPVRLAIG